MTTTASDTKTKKTGGLAGVSAGQTAISTVGKEGVGLTYRGYSIHDLAAQATFEEVAYLLLYGQLPQRQELNEFTARLVGHRALPGPMCTMLKSIPKSAHPMDVLRSGCSMLGCLETETSFDQQYRHAERMLGCFPSILNYWYHAANFGQEINFNSTQSSIAGYYLETLLGRSP
ncbi:MAG TPA: citrate/2-methylcitrate synthase, partial [Pirellulaceae bacterium]|nr:citrate/2-methylcitrate synthase [Pirellulaceae bacterium]